MKKKKNEKGLLSLEACIAVTIFIFFMLFLYSFFVVFEARNEMAHVLLSTTNSLSLDPYANEKLGNSGELSQLIYKLYNTTQSSNGGFTESDLWNEVKKDEANNKWDGSIYISAPQLEEGQEERYALSSELENAIEERFLAYLANGDRDDAEEILKRYHIVNGVEGLDFSASYISSGKIFVVVTYTLEYEYNMFGLDKIAMQHSACSKLWM